MQLNAAQEAALKHIQTPLLVLAGAGSGKTRVITQKIEWLIQRLQFSPQNVMALTFTNKAAEEMRVRLKKNLGKKAEELPISTFHSLGLRILREDGKHLGYKTHFSIFDSKDSLDLLKDLAPRLKPAECYFLQNKISIWKNAFCSPFALQPENDFEKKSIPIFNAYQKALKSYQAMDFDDLILQSILLFQNHPVVLEKWQKRIAYLLVDEYQDTNRAQYQLFHSLIEKNKMFTVVGDNDQSIYAWRGADIENLKRLQEDFPTLTLIKLEQNYRSTSTILNAANCLIQNNTHDTFFSKKLWSQLGKGNAIEVKHYDDIEKEAQNVIRLLIHQHNIHNRPWRDFAILYRSNHLAKPFEQALRTRQIPYVLSGGQSFFEKTEIKDLAAYLRLFLNSDDDPAFIRAANVPNRGLGHITLKTLGQWAGEKNCSFFKALKDIFHAPLVLNNHAQFSKKTSDSLRVFFDLIQHFSMRAQKEPPGIVLPELLKQIHYEHYLKTKDEKTATERFHNVCDFVHWLSEKAGSQSLNHCVQSISLFSSLENNAQNENAVQLSTIHAAKGLEYPVVYLVGAEEGILPHPDSDIQEERRLMYVAITRAKESLCISFVKTRKEKKERVAHAPSRFIEEMQLSLAESKKNNKQNVLAMLKMIQQQLEED